MYDQGNASGGEPWEEENPFEQEEVLPASQQGYGGERPDAEYVPEDAVVEYGQEGQDFYDPAGSADVEDDSVFLTESISATPEAEEPDFAGMPDAGQDVAYQETLIQRPSPPPEQPSDGAWDSQLDKMFPDNGFSEEGKLDWEKSEPPPPPAPEPYPSFPSTPPSFDPASATSEMEEEGVPDSPSGYVVITPSGRKKGVSPEIAQLLDRTSKRKDAVSALEEVQRSRKKWVVLIVILILLLVGAAGAAVYEFLEINKLKESHAQALQQTNAAHLTLKVGLEKQIGDIAAAKKDVDDKLAKLSTDFEAYKESVKDRLAQVDDLENSRNEVARNLEEAQTLNQRIPELEQQLQGRESDISRLKAEVAEVRSSVMTLEESNTGRGNDIERLEGEIEKREAHVKELQEEIDSLTGKGLTPKISASEYAKLKDEDRKKTSRIELLEKWSKQLEEQIEEIHIVGKGEKNILDQMNDLRMDLLRIGKDRMKLQEDLKNEQEARRRYSSPENTIIEWAQAHSTGKIEVLMKFYAENNRHRKRFEEGTDEDRGKLAAEFREFAAYEVDPRVLSVTINPKERQATAKLTLRLTLNGKTVEMPATMLLVREYNQWAILSEGF